MYNGQRISKKKTHVKKRTLNPVFNESFVFDLPRNESGLGKVINHIWPCSQTLTQQKQLSWRSLYVVAHLVEEFQWKHFIFKVQLEFMLLDWDRVTKNEVGCPVHVFLDCNRFQCTNRKKPNQFFKTISFMLFKQKQSPALAKKMYTALHCFNVDFRLLMNFREVVKKPVFYWSG